ncbi:hypothetical protein [Sphingobium yanoikuyae]|uniref:hypothetical protein n=1 Tax=Sphingobium yanoikuyae TaxID=13690 RepID=UPI002FDEF07A
MKTEMTPRAQRSWIVLDIESAVLDDVAHKRYQAMERWVPSDEKAIRRGYRRSEDPLTCPRWVFQTIATAAIMVLVEDAQGGVDVRRFITLSAPDHDERSVIAGILQALSEAPADAEIVTWMGLAHDLPLLINGALKHGLCLPPNWKWLAFGGYHRDRHIDLARAMTAGMKMKPIHLAEVLAAMDIPGKLTAPPFAITAMIYAGQWDEVQSACEVDVISTALLLARWRRLTDPRAEADAVEDRILRRAIELRAGRGYVPALEAHRKRQFEVQYTKAANDAARLAPWLKQDAA